MELWDIGATLPPGFRFNPSDEELVCHYLYKKIANEHVLKGTFVDIDLHTCEPWQLPDIAKLNEKEWYFFSFRDRKYATGIRSNRATMSGYWKATGKDRTVIDTKTGDVVGMRKTLVFYRNRAPFGIKSGWIMHEFRRHNPHMLPKEDWVLCRVFHKNVRENEIYATPSNVHHQIITPSSPIFSHQNHNQNFLDFLPFSQQPNTNILTESSNFKGDDNDCGNFLLDTNLLGDDKLENGEMRFEIDSSVFLL